MALNANSSRLLYDKALVDIREMILSGTFPPGAPLREIDIANKLEISRAPVREAFRILAEENLVEYIPNRGVRISEFSKDDIVEIYEVRQMIDCHIIDNYFDDLTEDDINELAYYTEHMTDRETYSEYNNLFHTKLVSVCKNQRIRDLWKSMKNQVRLLMHSCSSDDSLFKLSVYLHKEIFDSLKAGNREKCKEAIRIHYETAIRKLVSD